MKLVDKKNTNKKRDHPSLDIVSSHGVELSEKKIVLCVAGSVAAYKAIELARLLMRYGADVTCVATSAVTKLVQPEYFRWATGNEVITKLTGDLEHIRLADYNQADLIVVYPATANTLGKLANGIDDTPVSTVLTVGFGSKIPILMCLAMHQSMYDNSAVKKNIKFLKNKIEFLSPQLIEGKAKASEPEDVLEYILKKFGSSSILKNKKILMTAGPTIEYIDPVRVITNQSSGKTGVLLASELISAGSKVTLVYGPGIEKPPKGAKVIKVLTSKEMHDEVKKQMKKKFDVVIMAAAAADYTPENPSKQKIKSTQDSIKISLKKIPKIIDQIKKIQKDVILVGFKAETNLSKKALITIAKKKLDESNADMIIANDIGSSRYKKNPNNNEVLIVDSKKVRSSGWKNKQKIAKFILKEIENKLK
jgi:phosphopantothenoylcysteine decarboxylase/phosphopantothenate--cysteine ligase